MIRKIPATWMKREYLLSQGLQCGTELLVHLCRSVELGGEVWGSSRGHYWGSAVANGVPQWPPMAQNPIRKWGKEMGYCGPLVNMAIIHCGVSSLSLAVFIDKPHYKMHPSNRHRNGKILTESEGITEAKYLCFSYSVSSVAWPF